MTPKPLRETVTGQEFAGEIWAIRARETGCLICAIDDDGGNFLAYFSEADAIEGAAHQNDLYEIECYPVCLVRRREK